MSWWDFPVPVAVLQRGLMQDSIRCLVSIWLSEDSREDGGRARTYYVILCVHCTQKSTELLLLLQVVTILVYLLHPGTQPSAFPLAFQSPRSDWFALPEPLDFSSERA